MAMSDRAPCVTVRLKPDRRRADDARLITDLERARGDLIAALELMVECRARLEALIAESRREN